MAYKEWKDLDIFNDFEDLANRVWDEVLDWDRFSKNTIGRQLVEAIDSVSANIEEADGRFHFKDRLRFLYIARGSLKESRRWLEKATDRRLFKDPTGIYMADEIEQLLPRFNAFINNQKKRSFGNLDSRN